MLGFDRPPIERYLSWMAGAVHGDFGSSLTSRPGAVRAVSAIIGPRLYNTFFLAAMTAIIAVPLAILLGALTALYRGSFFDRAVNGLTLMNESTTIGERIWKLLLPSLTLTLVIIAHMMRMTRAVLINVLASPYIEMGRLKGLSSAWIVFKHALPNAWAPIATVVAFNLAYLIVGVVVVEVVFVYPGIGQLMVDAVRSRDMPVVQACALIFAATYIVLNLVADVIAIVTNPRLMYSR